MKLEAVSEENVEIRLARRSDLAALVDFNQRMARETEGRELDHATLSSGVAALVAREELGFYLVAEDATAGVVAALMVTYEWSDWRNGCFWWIQSVYVRPEFRRRGLYRALYAFVRKLGSGRGGVCGYRLYLEMDNEVARQTYAALGMEELPYRMFESR